MFTPGANRATTQTAIATTPSTLQTTLIWSWWGSITTIKSSHRPLGTPSSHSLQMTSAVRLGVAGVWLEPKAAVDTAGRVRGLGDDNPAVAATLGGPLCGNAEEVGSQPAASVLVVGADALVTRRATAPDDAQVGDESVVRERAEGGSDVPPGERTSRPCLHLSESLKGFRIVLIRSVVLRYGPGHGLHPVLATGMTEHTPITVRRNQVASMRVAMMARRA